MCLGLPGTLRQQALNACITADGVPCTDLDARLCRSDDQRRSSQRLMHAGWPSRAGCGTEGCWTNPCSAVKGRSITLRAQAATSTPHQDPRRCSEAGASQCCARRLAASTRLWHRRLLDQPLLSGEGQDQPLRSRGPLPVANRATPGFLRCAAPAEPQLDWHGRPSLPASLVLAGRIVQGAVHAPVGGAG